jgi:hypothetical protein
MRFSNNSLDELSFYGQRDLASRLVYVADPKIKRHGIECFDYVVPFTRNNVAPHEYPTP